jgi:type IV pilus assembly protein PilC
MLHLGEHTGGLDRALGNVASLYQRDVADSASRACRRRSSLR